ncbi:hypothetical protein [Streptomyces sp. NBC_00083]|uniref:hypothetical protein n=1 Tax=Streptomyces sp. NBC_00083 TaxID=2975647 RepID=UPI002251F780|nr:hypothetical protein [Streptomyces sp. NBC_00083]MCX5385239.1 hypothetical protein [Streptomyces sp. NBC_00083]
MGHHEAPNPAGARRRRALLRAGLTVTAAGAALAGAGTAAQAAPLPAAALGHSATADDLTAAAQGLTGSVGHAVGPLTGLRLDPLANTGVDPLTNGVATQVADFKPVSTTAATGVLTSGAALKDLPLVEGVTGILPS